MQVANHLLTIDQKSAPFGAGTGASSGLFLCLLPHWEMLDMVLDGQEPSSDSGASGWVLAQL